VKDAPRKPGFETLAIHAGQEPEAATGAVVVPIFQTSTFAQEAVGKHKGYEYARTGNPTRTALETCLAALEAGRWGLAFASGMAATDAIAHLLSNGDHVVMTYDHCGHCPSCESHAHTYCHELRTINFGGNRRDGTSPLSQDGAKINGGFFGQSSFATFAICNERNVVKVPADVPLEILGPLACGVQTGAGAAVNSLQVTPGSSSRCSSESYTTTSRATGTD